MPKSDARKRRYSVVIAGESASVRRRLENYRQLSYSTELAKLSEMNRSAAQSYREFVSSYRRYLEAIRAARGERE